jgi:hypothetical protein
VEVWSVQDLSSKADSSGKQMMIRSRANIAQWTESKQGLTRMVQANQSTTLLRLLNNYTKLFTNISGQFSSSSNINTDIAV